MENLQTRKAPSIFHRYITGCFHRCLLTMKNIRLFELNRQANYLRIRSQTSSNLRPSDYALQSSITETLKWARPVLGCKVWYFETSRLYYANISCKLHFRFFSVEIKIQTCRAESSCFKNCRSQRQVPKQNYNSHPFVNERSLWIHL